MNTTSMREERKAKRTR